MMVSERGKGAESFGLVSEETCRYIGRRSTWSETGGERQKRHKGGGSAVQKEDEEGGLRD